MSRRAVRERVVERGIRVETVVMTWCCVGRRVNNPRCGLGVGGGLRWTDLIQVDDSSSSLEPEMQLHPPTQSLLAPGAPRYRGTQVPKSLTSSASPAGTSCTHAVPLAAAGPFLPDAPIKWRSRRPAHRHRQGSELRCRHKVPCPKCRSKCTAGKMEGSSPNFVTSWQPSPFHNPGSKLSLLVTSTNHSQASSGTRQKFSCWSL